MAGRPRRAAFAERCHGLAQGYGPRQMSALPGQAGEQRILGIVQELAIGGPPTKTQKGTAHTGIEQRGQVAVAAAQPVCRQTEQSDAGTGLQFKTEADAGIGRRAQQRSTPDPAPLQAGKQDAATVGAVVETPHRWAVQPEHDA